MLGHDYVSVNVESGGVNIPSQAKTGVEWATLPLPKP